VIQERWVLWSIISNITRFSGQRPTRAEEKLDRLFMKHKNFNSFRSSEAR